MGNDPEILSVLKEMHELQIKSFERQKELNEMYKEQLAITQKQVQESLALQRKAVASQKLIQKVAMPILVIAIIFLAYLLTKL